jgi:hypothetical protein
MQEQQNGLSILKNSPEVWLRRNLYPSIISEQHKDYEKSIIDKMVDVLMEADESQHIICEMHRRGKFCAVGMIMYKVGGWNPDDAISNSNSVRKSMLGGFWDYIVYLNDVKLRSFKEIGMWIKENHKEYLQR